MRKQWLGLAVLIASGLVLVRCGGSTMQTTSTPAGSGQFVLMGTDAPVCSVASFDVTLTGVTLTPEGGGQPVSVVSSTNPLTVDFAQLMGAQGLLSLNSVPAGTYSEITLTLSNPQLTVFEGNPPVPTPVVATLSTATVTVTINPALQVTANGAVGLTIDFQLFKSMETDSSGQITGTINPSFRAVPAVITSGGFLSEIDDLTGIVETVSTSSTNPNFIGSFTLRVRNNRTFLVNVSSNTRFQNVSGLSGLTQGLFVEVKTRVLENGDILAMDVVSEAETDATTAGFAGPVVSVTEDANGLATQLSVFVRSEHPDVSATIPLFSTVTVNVSTETIYRIASFDTDLSAFLFGPASIRAGQHVVVHGPFTGGSSPTVTGNMVVLRPQAVLGNFQSLLAVGSDDKTGGYALTACNPLFRGQTADVLTFGTTTFSGVAGLNELSTTPPYLNFGYLLFSTGTGSLNGVSWQPQTYLVVARRVRQLNVP